MAQPFFFSSPEESVRIITELLISEDWEQLAGYYFLKKSDEATSDSLRNGTYFIRKEKPEVSHPGGFWKYKKPFPPGYDYVNHISVGKDTVEINVSIEIDQGGGMIQRSITSYYLVQSKKGYQLLL